MTTTYWHKHPRGFANECSLARCEDTQDGTEASAAGYTQFATLSDMRRHVAAVNANDQQWDGHKNIKFGDVEAGEGYRWIYVSQGVGA